MKETADYCQSPEAWWDDGALFLPDKLTQTVSQNYQSRKRDKTDM